jgi:hypothetical protein
MGGRRYIELTANRLNGWFTEQIQSHFRDFKRQILHCKRRRRCNEICRACGKSRANRRDSNMEERRKLLSTFMSNVGYYPIGAAGSGTNHASAFSCCTSYCNSIANRRI